MFLYKSEQLADLKESIFCVGKALPDDGYCKIIFTLCSIAKLYMRYYPMPYNNALYQILPHVLYNNALHEILLYAL